MIDRLIFPSLEIYLTMCPKSQMCCKIHIFDKCFLSLSLLKLFIHLFYGCFSYFSIIIKCHYLSSGCSRQHLVKTYLQVEVGLGT